MSKRLFHENWLFLKQPVDSTLEEVLQKKDAFVPINLPHDWQIYQGHDLYEDSTGWYRKTVLCEKKNHRHYEIYFEGVYMDTTVYVNGHRAGEWKYGYSSFVFDVTQYLADGENEIFVQVKVKHPNSRWYSGAGIFRNVYWRYYDTIAFAWDSSYILTGKENDSCWRVEASIGLSGLQNINQESVKQLYYRIRIADESGNIVAQEKERLDLAISEKKDAGFADDETYATILMYVENPMLWNLETPSLYTCEMSLLQEKEQDEKILDTNTEKIGFREFTFDHDKGCFINGKHVKLNGVCEHHDFGAIGAAYHQAAMRRKLEILKDMGVNAIRTSHNMPAKGLLELTDEMGMIVMDEAFDMWERPKTEYDYARFFKEWYQKDVASWIRRDRNHPSIMFWSIGNEIYDTHADKRGLEITRMLRDEVLKHDPFRNATVTICSNYMPWENARKCADEVKFAGYNYGEKYYDEQHKEHPDWYIYGSETASTVQSRGIYHFPYKQSVLADEDEQCSALGNSTTSWGAKSSEYCIIAERDREYSLGQFLWTGFDYIGEPTPYHTRNSYFGQIDTAGFPKDAYYVYQSAWTDFHKKPVIHIFPYWDFNPGQLVDVRVATNAPKVELFLNGRSLGVQEIDHLHGEVLTGNWLVPYEEGSLTGVAYDENGVEVCRETRVSFGNAYQIKMEQYKPERELVAGCNDLLFMTISVEDEKGNPVENANNLIQVSVTGEGWLTGLDNGDSTDTDEYKGFKRRLFSGKLLAIVAVGEKTGEIRIKACSQGLIPCEVVIPVTRQVEIEGVSHLAERFEDYRTEESGQNTKNWIRKLVLHTDGERILDAERKEMDVTVSVEPECADELFQKELIWKITNDAGVESNLARLEKTSRGVKVIAMGDGDFRLRCMTKNGCRQVKVISQIEFHAEGIGQAYLNPYELVAGALYTYVEGEAGNGNEHGVSTAREGRTIVGFEHIDFGSFGSDTITLPIFELGGEPCPVQIWEGIPEKEGSVLLADVVYHKPSVWNTYQSETYQLAKRLSGITSLYFVFYFKVHLKGFVFEKQEKALARLDAALADQIYGDMFVKKQKEVLQIGNNVTMEFRDMNFGEGIHQITICGKTPNDVNTIHLQFADEETGEDTRQVVEFTRSDDWKECTFTLAPVVGKKTLRFVFLPGSHFDFAWFKFQQ